MFVEIPSRQQPRAAIATCGLVALNLIAFVAFRLLPEEQRLLWVRGLGVTPADWIGWPALSAQELAIRVLHLASALFVHVNGPHLIGNLVFLLVFGVSAEKPLGARRLLALFVTCGMIANLVGAGWYGTADVLVVGASGAVSALVGAYATLFPRARLGLVLPLGVFFEFVRMPAYGLIGLWVMVQILMFVSMPGVDTVAWPVHLAGFGAGVGFALLSRQAILRRLRG